jgi:hypothetical protein
VKGDSNDEGDHTPHFEHVEPDAAMLEADAFSCKDHDKYISAEVMLTKGDNLVLGKVIARKRDANDNLIGTPHNNPIFNSCLYQVQFPEGQVEECSANITLLHRIYTHN